MPSRSCGTLISIGPTLSVAPSWSKPRCRSSRCCDPRPRACHSPGAQTSPPPARSRSPSWSGPSTCRPDRSTRPHERGPCGPARGRSRAPQPKAKQGLWSQEPDPGQRPAVTPPHPLVGSQNSVFSVIVTPSRQPAGQRVEPLTPLFGHSRPQGRPRLVGLHQRRGEREVPAAGPHRTAQPRRRGPRPQGSATFRRGRVSTGDGSDPCHPYDHRTSSSTPRRSTGARTPPISSRST